jgi:hypothetical protein
MTDGAGRGPVNQQHPPPDAGFFDDRKKALAGCRCRLAFSDAGGGIGGFVTPDEEACTWIYQLRV